MEEHELQAKVAIAAALIQSQVVTFELGRLIGGSDNEPTNNLRKAVDRIYNALNNPPPK